MRPLPDFHIQHVLKISIEVESVEATRGIWWEFLLHLTSQREARPVTHIPILQRPQPGLFQQLGSQHLKGWGGKLEHTEMMPFLHIRLLDKNSLTV